MAVRKKKVQEIGHPSCEQMNSTRTLQCSESGARCAKAAIEKGQTINHARAYIYLMGTNNTAAFMEGWNKEWAEIIG